MSGLPLDKCLQRLDLDLRELLAPTDPLAQSGHRLISISQENQIIAFAEVNSSRHVESPAQEGGTGPRFSLVDVAPAHRGFRLADQGVEGGDYKRGAEDQEQVTAGEIVCLMAPELSRQ